MKGKLAAELLVAVAGAFILTASGEAGQSPSSGAPLSEATGDCIECHEGYSPGIVADWRTSRHARTTPKDALAKPALERRVSSPTVPEELASVAVGCYECHGLNPSAHKDNFKHFGYEINTVVSPNDCKICHTEEADQYAGSKKAEALHNLQKNPVYHALVDTVTGVKTIDGVAVVAGRGSEETKSETCYACHGTVVKVEGMQEAPSVLKGVMVPKLTNWPNQGVGRINPDGSAGSCAACHPRHSFSIEIARKPQTCSQCHLEPDVPAWEVYRESKHGNIALSMQHEWNWQDVPWEVGEDFRAPTCATCHNSLVVAPAGKVIAERTHDFGARLWVRIFGLPYSHPQPKSGATYEIRNADGLPLPTTFTGEPAAEFLIDTDEQAKRRKNMTNLCRSCHSASWVDGHFERFDVSVSEADKMVLAATRVLQQAWAGGLADNANPFDEVIEQKWVQQWLFYATSVRYAAAMGGPDFASFKNGWWSLTHNLADMRRQVTAGKPEFDEE